VRNNNNFSFRYSLEEIETVYESHLDVIKLERSYTEVGDHEKHLEMVERYKKLSDAYEDIREYLEFQHLRQRR
jgi:hypothetical protein